MRASPVFRSLRRHPVWVGVGVAALLTIVFFDCNWFRVPVEQYVSYKTKRTFRISDLDVRLGLVPTIILRDVYFSNAAWGMSDPMARVEKLEFSVSLRDVFRGKILVPRMSLTHADVLMELAKDGERNWRIAEPGDRTPGTVRISTLSVDQGRLRYFNHGLPFELELQADTFDPAVDDKVRNADAQPANSRYTTRYAIRGKYRDATFSGSALTGDTLSFQQSGEPFPLKGTLEAGSTRLDVEGTIADAADVSAIDARLKIQGRTMANLYPFLLLPLPASPPYQLQGHIVLKGNRYSLDDLSGTIGATDVSGHGAYVQRDPRPLLTADLHSKLLDLADLGPMIGIRTEPTTGKPTITQAQTTSRSAARNQQPADRRGKILPAGTFESTRLRAIDADVDLTATKLKAPAPLPFESLRGSLRLHDGILKLEPLDIGFAGGVIASHVTLDARQPTLKTDADTTLRRIRMDRLLPHSDKVAASSGVMNARMQLHGTGNSIADMAATSNGTMSATISKGQVSNLLDAASGLNFGKVLTLLAGGDKDIAIRCGGAAFDVKDGKGTSTLFVIDTEQTQVLGNGGFDFGQETFDMTVAPKPKQKGFLSLRTPVRLYGTFAKPDYELQKGPLAARAAGALALLVIAPIAALIPLIETGPGEDTDCAKVLAGSPAAGQAGAPVRK